MHTNFGNCATAAREPFMSPLTADSNGSGQQAAHWLADRVREEGLTACQVSLPDGHDPDSFFVAGGGVQEFQHLLDGACL
jgi:hypothetical protein